MRNNGLYLQALRLIDEMYNDSLGNDSFDDGAEIHKTIEEQMSSYEFVENIKIDIIKAEQAHIDSRRRSMVVPNGRHRRGWHKKI